MSEPVLWFAKSDDGVSYLSDVRENAPKKLSQGPLVR
jgi:hypothetical protein